MTIGSISSSTTNEIAAITIMGNCIGINRSDPETLDTGSANVTRPVTGKCCVAFFFSFICVILGFIPRRNAGKPLGEDRGYECLIYWGVRNGRA